MLPVKLGCPARFFGGNIMSVGQQIYFAIELFAPQAHHRERFCAQLAKILRNNGSTPEVARTIASVLADALSKPCADYHLEMAHLIAFHPPLTAAMDGDSAAIYAMHRYMTYFLDVTAIDAGPEARYAVN